MMFATGLFKQYQNTQIDIYNKTQVDIVGKAHAKENLIPPIDSYSCHNSNVR